MELVTRRARMLFSVFILIALVLVLAVFTVLTAGTFVQAPEIVLPSWGILPVAALVPFFSARGSVQTVTAMETRDHQVSCSCSWG